jgi:ferredoxin
MPASPLQQQLEAETGTHREHYSERSFGWRLGDRPAQDIKHGYMDVPSPSLENRSNLTFRPSSPGRKSSGLKQFEAVLMRIVVDLNRCLGYAQCVPLAPEVLKLSGEEALTYNPNPDDSQRLRVLRAAASCPVQAIIVDRLDDE